MSRLQQGMVTDGARADHYDVAGQPYALADHDIQAGLGHGHLALGPELGEVVGPGEQ